MMEMQVFILSHTCVAYLTLHRKKKKRLPQHQGHPADLSWYCRYSEAVHWLHELKAVKEGIDIFQGESFPGPLSYISSPRSQLGLSGEEALGKNPIQSDSFST
jgi:hypothetical protein